MERRDMLATADVMIESWPGPMPGNPIILGQIGQAVIFAGDTPEGWALFKTDGTLEGTARLTEPSLADRPSGVFWIDRETYFLANTGTEVYRITEEGAELASDRDNARRTVGTFYWTTDTLQATSDPLKLLQTVNYEDADGRQFTYEAELSCINASRCTQQVRKHLVNVMGVSESDVIVSVDLPEDSNSPFAYMASGSFETWTPIDNIQYAYAHEVILTDGTSLLKGSDIYTLAGERLVVRPLEVQRDYQQADPSTLYVYSGWSSWGADGKIGRIVSGEYQVLFDMKKHEFEFPTTLVVMGESVKDGVLLELSDPVYGASVHKLADDGTLTRLVTPEGDVLPWARVIGRMSGYDFLHTPVVGGTFQTYTLDGAKLVPVELDTAGHRIYSVDDRVIFEDDGREITARTLLPGDANLDGLFDTADLLALFQLGEYEDGVPDNSNWFSGDWNEDGEFDSSDLIEALALGWYEN
jgi:hypothetical protein